MEQPRGFAIQVGWSSGSSPSRKRQAKRWLSGGAPLLAINLSFLSTSAPSQGPPFSLTQLTSFFNPSTTADPRTRGSVRRASSFVQIAITLIAHYLAFL